jgi:hypothetical protein
VKPAQAAACAARIPDPGQRLEFLRLAEVERVAFEKAWDARREMWLAYRCFRREKPMKKRAAPVSDGSEFV